MDFYLEARKELDKRINETREKALEKLDAITEAAWQMLPLHVEFQGAHVIACEE